MERRSVWLFFVIKCDVGTVPPEDQLHCDRQHFPYGFDGGVHEVLGQAIVHNGYEAAPEAVERAADFVEEDFLFTEEG